MQDTTNTTTVLCLFHTQEHAQEAMAELNRLEIPSGSIKTLAGEHAAGGSGHAAALTALGVPEKDVELLHSGIHKGGTVIVVTGTDAVTSKAETVFARHYGRKIDETYLDTPAVVGERAVGTADGVIPVVQEELVVGKRQVQTGGVRVYSHVVDVPVQEQITLQQERAVIERHAVDRPVTDADFAGLSARSIEVTESEEVPVISKTARVVEEISVSKDATERTEVISDSVRSTEVEVDAIEGESLTGKRKGL